MIRLTKKCQRSDYCYVKVLKEKVAQNLNVIRYLKREWHINRAYCNFCCWGGDHLLNNTLLEYDVTHRDPLSVVMDAGSRLLVVNFIRDGTAFG